MKIVKSRMSSFAVRCKALLDSGKKQEAFDLQVKGLDYYTQKIIKAISPYAKADAGMLVFILRHLAEEIADNNAGAKEYADFMAQAVKAPKLNEEEKVQKPNAQ